MQRIVPHLWFDTHAVEAAKFYVELFEGSEVTSVSQIKDTPSGDCDIVSFSLAGLEFQAISAGPFLKFNPSISLFTVFDDEEEIERVWKALSEGGKVLMEFGEYPWARRYGWLEDKYGLSWQLSMSEHHQLDQKITPLLMFTQDQAGKVKEALEMYTGLFPDSGIDVVAEYEEGEGDVKGYVKHASFRLAGQGFMAMESTGPHEFVFNEAVSLIVRCEDQEEIDRYWEALSAVPEAEQCGWLKDKYGVSWQVTPVAMDEMMSSNDEEAKARATQAFLGMKKFVIAEIEKAFRGE